MKNRTLLATSRPFAARMNLRALPLIMGFLLLQLACGDPTGPRPSELCSDYSGSAIAKFEDDNLEAALVRELQVGGSGDLTCYLVSRMTSFVASYEEVESLVGVQNLTGLTRMSICCNSIRNISPLSGLSSLTSLSLHNNSISDISPLSGLSSLTSLSLDANSITDISVLSGLTSLGSLSLSDNPISDISPLSGLTSLNSLSLNANSITDISVLSGLTSLGGLTLHNNSISDVSVLSGLTILKHLQLGDNQITDISALSGLTLLVSLALAGNSDLSNIQPLLDNTGLGTQVSNWVDLRATSVNCTDVAALEAKGVTVESDCP